MKTQGEPLTTANTYKMNSERRQTEANNMDKLRRNLSSQVKDLQGRLDESEAARAGAGKRQIANLELRGNLFFRIFKSNIPIP